MTVAQLIKALSDIQTAFTARHGFDAVLQDVYLAAYNRVTPVRGVWLLQDRDGSEQCEVWADTKRRSKGYPVAVRGQTWGKAPGVYEMSTALAPFPGGIEVVSDLPAESDGPKVITAVGYIWPDAIWLAVDGVGDPQWTHVDEGLVDFVRSNHEHDAG